MERISLARSLFQGPFSRRAGQMCHVIVLGTVDGPLAFSLKCNRSKPNSACGIFRTEKKLQQSNDTVFGVNVADKAASDTFHL